MTKVGLGAATYHSILSEAVAEMLAKCTGQKPDVQTAVASMLYKFGFNGFFDASDNLKIDDVRAALLEMIPPQPVDPSAEAAARLEAARADWFGTGSEEAFNALPPERRLSLLAESERITPPAPSASNWFGMGSRERFEALPPSERLRLAHAADARPRKPTGKVAMPVDAAEWRPVDRLSYASARNDEERAAMAAQARANVKADVRQREETERENTELNG